MDLSITNLEAERQRREIQRKQNEQIAHIERIARSGGELPTPKFGVNISSTRIVFDDLEIKLQWTQLGEDPDTKKLVVDFSKKDLEEKLHAFFPDKAVTKKIYDHVLKTFAEYMGNHNGAIKGCGDTKFCG